MWSRLYRDHFIMAFPSFDTATQSWAPQVDITWVVGSSRDSEFIRSPNRLRTETEAVTFALDTGKAWVDDRLSRPERAAAYGQITNMMAALKSNLNKAIPKQSPEKAFTFDQFKFALGRHGIEVSEPTLKRSYAALVKLLENQRLSWADARRKLESSQRTLAATAQLSMRRPRGARLPLTERDWGKLG